MHINSMILNLLFTEGAEENFSLGTNTYITSFFIISSIIALEFLLFRKLYVKFRTKPITRKAIFLTIILCVTIVFSDKLTYAFGDLYNKREITRHKKVFPLYQPMTIKRFMRKKFGFKIDREETIKFDKKYTSLNYPKAELEHTQQKEYPNIIWILIDAWRFDMFTQELTPNIKKFSNRSMVFTNHYSGGNASRFGVFSLFYGIYGYYWHHFLGERRSPVFIDELVDLDYDFKIISSKKLTNPEFRKTAFIKIPDYIVDTLPGKNAEERDPVLTQTFLNWLDERNTSKPFFAFLFYHGPHGPYSYPDEFEIYTPSNKDPNYIMVRKKDVIPLLNSYKNAICFNDFEVGNVLDALEEKDLLENTIIVISSDHGEEFYETGFWGHTSAFSKFQIKVPFILYIPDEQHRTISYLTSHIDVVPTMFEMLGYTSPPDIYTQGRSILDEDGHDFVVSCGWDDCAIIDRENIMLFSFESYNLASVEVRDTTYQFIDNDKEILKSKSANIIEVLNGFREFIK
jgi:membrane-anchored protein YejM (alkaline phosphatase superfamily)